MYTKRAEFKAGVVVLAAIAALLALLYFAGGSEPIWGDYRYIHVRFEQGFTAPKVGDAANMNGVQIGRVTQVLQRDELRGTGSAIPLTPEDRRRLGITDDATGSVREVYVLAVIKMPVGQEIPQGTTAQIDKSLTGIRTLALRPGVSKENLTDAETHESPIPGREAPGIGDIAAQVSELVDKIEGLVGSGTEVMAEAKALLQGLRQKIEAFNTAELDADARAAVASLKRTLESLETKLEVIGTNIVDASSSVKEMAGKGVQLVDAVTTDVGEVLAGVKKVVARLDVIVADAQGPVKDILGNLHVASTNVAGATEGLAGLGPQARGVLADLGVDLATLLKNLNDTAHNLLDASEDLRTHPWKLLNEPEEKEIAFANLRNASQSYVRAMREVNEASARLFTLMERKDLDDPKIQDLVRRALDAFTISLDGYRRAEARWQKLFKEARAGKK